MGRSLERRERGLERWKLNYVIRSEELYTTAIKEIRRTLSYVRYPQNAKNGFVHSGVQVAAMWPARLKK